MPSALRGSLIENPNEHARDGLMHCCIAGEFRRLCVGGAAHGRIGWAAVDHDGHATVRRLLHHGGLRQLDEQLSLARLQHCLSEDALFPIATLQCEGGGRGPLDAPSALGLLARCRILQRFCK